MRRYPAYATAWRWRAFSGNYAHSHIDQKCCQCCGKGAKQPKPLIGCHVMHIFSRAIDEHLLCYTCLRYTLQADEQLLAAERLAQRAHFNERAFSHILAPLRGEYSAYIDSVPCLRKFMQAIQSRQCITPKILNGVVQWLKDNRH